LVDTSNIHVDDTRMATRTKRTYSLRPETLHRVRELAARYGTSQDGLVDTAVERLYRAARDDDESRSWESAARDEDFKREMGGLTATFDEADTWPA
jgi:hypothetical protein